MGMGMTGKGHQAVGRALSLGQARTAEMQPLPHHQQHESEQSPRILLHEAMISVQKLPPSIINHTWVPAHGVTLGQIPHPGVYAKLPGSMWGWKPGTCPV